MSLIYHCIEEYISAAVKESQVRLLIVCPFVKVAPLARILQVLPSDIKVEIVTAWKFSNFQAGVSDVEIFDFCNQSGIVLRANNRIHLKVWLIDDIRLLATSANITDSALGAALSPNHEFLTDIKPSQLDFKALDSILHESIEITDSIYRKTVELLGQSISCKTEDIDLLDFEPTLENLVEDIPRTSSHHELYSFYSQADSTYPEDVEHDLERLKIPPGLSVEYFILAVDRSFFRLPIINKVLSRLSEAPMFFGEMKAFLQEINDSDPKPTRRELTPITQNLYTWLRNLRPNMFIVDQPNYAERITMITG